MNDENSATGVNLIVDKDDQPIGEPPSAIHNAGVVVSGKTLLRVTCDIYGELRNVNNTPMIAKSLSIYIRDMVNIQYKMQAK